ncbi:MAG TPA: 5'-3' exonuclease [Actinomycetota bacterium]
MKTNILLDTSSLMYRAFFSVPATIVGRDRRPVNAVHGYLDMTARLIDRFHPDDCVHVFDNDWRPAWRVDQYAGYKAQRAADPEGLPEQFDLLRSVLDAGGWAHAESEGWEAEDAIGGLTARGGRGDRFEIVTGDRDLLQLVRDPVVRVLFTLRGVSELREFDEAEVESRYGVPASRYADFAILRGDPSDGLPGVRGVGEKTARALTMGYRDLDHLLAEARAERRSPGPLQGAGRLVATLRDSGDYLAAMRRIVPIRTDVDVSLTREQADPDRLESLAREHRLVGPVERLQKAQGGSSG